MDYKIKVYIVEDQVNILRTQIKILKKFKEIDVLGSSLSAEDALEEIKELEPDVILMDLGLPGIDGIQLTKLVKEVRPDIEILIFTIFSEEEKVIKAIQAGASGYLLKGTTSEKIIYAIKSVFEGGSFIQPSLARMLLKHFTTDNKRAREIEDYSDEPVNLTKREVEILQLITKGLTNKEVANVLNLSRSTIRTHLEHIYQKMEVSNRVEAITEGYKRGIVDFWSKVIIHFFYKKL